MRLPVLGAPIAMVAVLAMLSACGDGTTSSATTPLVIISDSTSFATTATLASTLPPTTVEGDVASGEQEYVVQDGDVLVNIAKAFGLQAIDIATYNGWGDGLDHLIFQGMKIKIPPGGLVPGETVPGDTTEPNTTVSTLSTDGCAPGTYTIVADDYPTKVAAKFDVSVAELDAANQNTAGYSAFFVGLKIVIPPRSSCQ